MWLLALRMRWRIRSSGLLWSLGFANRLEGQRKLPLDHGESLAPQLKEYCRSTELVCYYEFFKSTAFDFKTHLTELQDPKEQGHALQPLPGSDLSHQ